MSLIRAFHDFDANDDGLLRVGEVYRAIEAFGYKNGVSGENLKIMFREVDKILTV